MKFGYHSYYHQFRFLDNCFIHKCKLVNRCNCKYGYAMQYRNIKWEAFQCMECNKKPDNLPAALDGISINWNIPINFKIKYPPTNIQRILCVDAAYELSGNRRPFTDNQNACLRNIFFNRRMEECKPIIIVNKYSKEDKPERYNLAEILQDEIYNKYGIEYCKKQFEYVQRFHKTENLLKVNPEVIALFYIIQELRYSKHIDTMYPVEFGILKEPADYKDNIYWDIACKWRMYYCNQRYTYLDSQKTSWITHISNFLYDKIVRCRYQEIIDYFKENQNIEYFSEHNIPYNTENYPTFIIVDYFNKMGRKVEVY